MCVPRWLGTIQTKLLVVQCVEESVFDMLPVVKVSGVNSVVAGSANMGSPCLRLFENGKFVVFTHYLSETLP